VTGSNDRFIRSVALPPDRVPDPSVYPFSIPAVRALAADALELDPGVTFLVGENGSGKSTLIEAIAVAAGFNPEGGTTGMRFSTQDSHSAPA
jgi:predicted ATPase